MNDDLYFDEQDLQEFLEDNAYPMVRAYVQSFGPDLSNKEIDEVSWLVLRNLPETDLALITNGDISKLNIHWASFV
jgi:hypothetical protein